MLKPIEIHEPETAQEASTLLREYGWDAALYAGGTELLVVMREGLAHYPHLINVKTISGLDTIDFHADDDVLRIGAGASHRTIETSTLVTEHAPLLAEVEQLVANIRVRVMGTIGGNLCFAEPHSDPATLFMAWEGAGFDLVSGDGLRSVSPEDFFIDLFMTARQDDEVMTAITLPTLPAGMGGAYQKFVQLERPSANVASFVTMADGKIDSAQIAVGSVGPVPYRAVEAESALRGETPGEALYVAAGEAAASAADPVSDLYGSAEYKKQLVRVLTRRALEQAVSRAGGGAS